MHRLITRSINTPPAPRRRGRSRNSRCPSLLLTSASTAVKLDPYDANLRRCCEPKGGTRQRAPGRKRGGEDRGGDEYARIAGEGGRQRFLRLRVIVSTATTKRPSVWENHRNPSPHCFLLVERKHAEFSVFPPVPGSDVLSLSRVFYSDTNSKFHCSKRHLLLKCSCQRSSVWLNAAFPLKAVNDKSNVYLSSFWNLSSYQLMVGFCLEVTQSTEGCVVSSCIPRCTFPNAMQCWIRRW